MRFGAVFMGSCGVVVLWCATLVWLWDRVGETIAFPLKISFGDGT